jgi:hypothetical protein
VARKQKKHWDFELKGGTGIVTVYGKKYEVHSQQEACHLMHAIPPCEPTLLRSGELTQWISASQRMFRSSLRKYPKGGIKELMRRLDNHREQTRRRR